MRRTTGSSTAAFIDSNVLLYLLSSHPDKADRAEALLMQRPVISVQVLNEITSVCVRKLGKGWREVAEFLEPIRDLCLVVPLTVEVHDLARRLAERYRLSFFDACIVAAAMEAGCQTLFSEDMHGGMVIDGTLTIRNPFQTER